MPTILSCLSLKYSKKDIAETDITISRNGQNHHHSVRFQHL